MKKTKFHNATGLTNSDYGSVIIPGANKNDYNISSAREVSYIARKLVSDFPEVLNYTQKNEYKFRNEKLKKYFAKYNFEINIDEPIYFNTQFSSPSFSYDKKWN